MAELPGVPIVCLDFHWSAAPGRRADARAAGALVRAAKYSTGSEAGPSAATGLLAGRLGLVLGHSAIYRQASDVVPVLSSHRLAADLAHRLALECSFSEGIRLEESHDERQPFRVVGDATGKTIVLIDDVYRTGVTFADAAEALRAAGAMSVLGLVTTCTFTATRETCGMNEVDRIAFGKPGMT